MCSFTTHLLVFWITSAICAICLAQQNAQMNTPFMPPSWPLAVKGPYLNSWQAGGKDGTLLPMSSPAFWPAWDDQTTWRCIVVVDNIPYRIMGSDTASATPNVSIATQISVSFTATRTTFVFSAGPINVTTTFLSPVTPNDLMRQSMPFAYFYLDIFSADGAAHNVRVYTDINPQWLHGSEVLVADPSPKVAANASLIESSNFVGLQMQLQVPQPFVEIADHAQDVIGIYAIKSAPTVKYQVGPDVTVRTFGLNSTGLQNTVDANYSAHALDNPFDAYAISSDLGIIQNTSEPIVWTIGMLRDPSINLTTASGANQLRSSYYWSDFSTIPDIITFVLNDFDMARSSADAFDQMLRNVSLSHVAGYTDLLALATRQIFGTLEITVSKSSDGTWNQSDVMILSKDMGGIGSAGTSGGTNVVDVLYAGFPAILFLNPKLGEYLLRPILESQVNNGTLIGQAYAPQNLGSQFPNVLSNTSPHNYGIEESGNMLIMVLAHLQTTQDRSIVQTHYTLLKSWADYLVNQTLNAGFQSSSASDAIASLNETNLALKGVIGISAMSSISAAVNEENDEQKYQAIAKQYMEIWLNGALSQDGSHLLSSLGNQNSNGMIYNMYADKLLGLNLVPSNISQIQSRFYEMLFSTNRTSYGIPLDSSNPSLTRLDWTMFSAASTLDDKVANGSLVLQSAVPTLENYASSQKSNSPLAVVYNPGSGAQLSGSNSLAIGSIFAPLMINSKSAPDGTPGQNTSSRKAAMLPIVVGVVGGACALLVTGLGFLAWRSRRWNARSQFSGDRIKRERDRKESYDLGLEFKLQGVLRPSAEDLISPFDVPAAPSNATRISLPLFISGREKYPPLPESVEDTIHLRKDSVSESVHSGSDISSELSNSSAQRLEGRLADLMVEMQMVRNAIQNTRPTAMLEDVMSEAPPSYDKDNHDVGEQAV